MGCEDRKIRVIAVAIVKSGDKILALKGHDSKKNEDFYRLMGGGVDFGETAENALIREFEEELGIEIKVSKLIKVVENIFSFEGKIGHEVCFVYEIELADKSLYNVAIPMIEEHHKGDFAEWIEPLDNVRIYPINPKGL